MTLQFDNLLDDTGWQILSLLQDNARLSFRDLGKKVGLSAPAAAERVRRMEEAGIIRGYRAEVDLEKLGLSLLAFIRLSVPKEDSNYIAEQLKEIPEILECYRVLGVDTFLMKVSVPSVEHLERVIDRLRRYGQSTTSIVLSATMDRQSVERSEDF
ncbi:MAG TPA: Lrp/AsnC family transcriptional regulator [Ktedonobacteraceae bacterium]|jgi:Lrp/AsnC family leucine-responsive transcriptional regulator|nr:Lrp/AsnC family transcriptional regulator [Ktedonobacteraceae bacterium]